MKIPKDYNLEVQFHFTERIIKRFRKSNHRLSKKDFDAVKEVLKINPERGPPIPGFGHLRKMRVSLPRLNIGKSGGYRLVYRKVISEELVYIIFLTTYFKSEVENLSYDQLEELEDESERVLDNILNFKWES